MIGRWVVRGLLLAASGAVAAPLDPPPREVLVEAQRIVQEMRANPRGPYSRIAWFCNDGSIQPPLPYACRERGGGRQHAVYSPARERLAELGWSVGTIFAALEIGSLLNDPPRRTRLRQLPLERFLLDIDDGWVLTRAQGYRGRVQAEDEQAAGRSLLESLYADLDWLRGNFLLARELARVVPHGEDSNLARRVRRLAVELAELEPAAERWRAEIHATPDRSSAPRLRRWAADRSRAEVVELANELAGELERLFGESGRGERIATLLGSLGNAPPAAAWRTAVQEALGRAAGDRLQPLCTAMAAGRMDLLPVLDGRRRLALFDALQALETDVQLDFLERDARGDWQRAELLAVSRSLVDCAFAAGFVSPGERDWLRNFDPPADGSPMAFTDYRAAVDRLKRAPGWATGTIRHAFAEALTSWTALDPRAARFADDLLRGSPVWLLGTTLKYLAADADRLSGQTVEVAGQPLPTAIALNAGIARGRLRILATLDEAVDATLTTADIVVLPETIAELPPVAGILTLGEGSPVSHVQLLARNFAIPNVAIAPDALELLEPLAGRDVVLAVGSDGNVVLREADEDTLAALAVPTAAPAESLTVPVPDLGRTEILHLGDLGRELSGRVVGPKAANLGELNRLFPGRVAPALAIPFGVYAAQLREAGLDERIREAFADQARGLADREQTFARLADVRREIAALELSPATRDALAAAMRREFGESQAVGLFVRSDTNVEDLPQFTGAGLNETVPNVVGFDAQLAQVPRVWGSVLSPRALAWRSSVLTNPDQIYASILLMLSVPADKSGVLVTANLVDRDAGGMTASTAWGVGGAVAGEAAETLVIRADGRDLVSEAKAPYRRRLADAGGIDWAAAPAGPVLTADEISQLRALAADVAAKYEPVLDDAGEARPWDIEFGFVAGRLTLFQIRPLVERGSRQVDALVARLLPPRETAGPPATVAPDTVIGGSNR